jgi:hypothetical protein
MLLPYSDQFPLDSAVVKPLPRRLAWPQVLTMSTCDPAISINFCFGTRVGASRSIDHYVRERVRAFLARRHKVAGRGNHRFTFDAIHRELGVLCLERLPRPAPSWALR